MTTFGDQVFEFGGAPVSGGRFSSPWATHYFVDATDGAAGNGGKRPDDAMSTIQAAVSLASAGDVIYIRPQTYKLGTGFNRYTEDVTLTLGGTGGSGVVATNANISIIGVTPQGRPTDFLGVRWKATTTGLQVDAPGLHLEGIGFFTETATHAVNLRCNGATRTQEGTTGFSMYNCAVKGDGPVYANGGNEIVISNCRFQAKHDGTVGGINLVGSTNAVARPVIENCDFIGGNANVMATAPIIGASPWYTAILKNLWFDKIPTSGQFVTISGTSCVGVIGPCYCGSDDIGASSFDAAGMWVIAYDNDGVQAGPEA